eukprot:1373123-Amorphochlora_amoeboformis.AAC.1
MADIMSCDVVIKSGCHVRPIPWAMGDVMVVSWNYRHHVSEVRSESKMGSDSCASNNRLSVGYS